MSPVSKQGAVTRMTHKNHFGVFRHIPPLVSFIIIAQHRRQWLTCPLWCHLYLFWTLLSSVKTTFSCTLQCNLESSVSRPSRDSRVVSKLKCLCINVEVGCNDIRQVSPLTASGMLLCYWCHYFHSFSIIMESLYKRGSVDCQLPVLKPWCRHVIK